MPVWGCSINIILKCIKCVCVCTHTSLHTCIHACDLVTLRTRSIRLFLVFCGELSLPVPELTAALCSLSLQQDWTELKEQKQEKPQVKIKNSLISEWKKEEKNPRDAKTNHSLPPISWAMTAPVLLWAWCHVALWSNRGSSLNLLPIPEGGRVRNRGPWCCASTVQPELQHCCATNTSWVIRSRMQHYASCGDEYSSVLPVHVCSFRKKKKKARSRGWNLKFKRCRKQHGLFNSEDSFITGIICKELVDSPSLSIWLRIRYLCIFF